MPVESIRGAAAASGARGWQIESSESDFDSGVPLAELGRWTNSARTVRWLRRKGFAAIAAN